MSLTFGEGAALAIHLNSLDTAPSSSSRDARRVRELEAMNARLLARNKELEQQLVKQRDESTAKLVTAARFSSAGWVVMNGMIRAMDNLEPQVREKFRSEVVEYSQNRISVLDQKYIEESNRGKFSPVTIMSVFKVEPEFKTLGFQESPN